MRTARLKEYVTHFFSRRPSRVASRAHAVLDGDRSSFLFAELGIQDGTTGVFGRRPSITQVQLLPPHVVRANVAGTFRCFSISTDQREALAARGVGTNDYAPVVPMRPYREIVSLQAIGPTV